MHIRVAVRNSAILQRRIPPLFFFNEVLDEAEDAPRFPIQNSEAVYSAVGTSAEDVVSENTWYGGVGCRGVAGSGGTAPGRPDVAAVDADYGAGEAGFEEGWGGGFVIRRGGVEEAG
jgi:hypothetical protein